MDDEVEDAVGDVKYTDSQKSVATSNVYSLDFTDSSPERVNSSGRETYIIEWDDSEDSEPVSVDTKPSTIYIETPMKSPIVNRNVQWASTKKVDKASSTCFGNYSIIAQEIYTQTSKTIIELAENEAATKKPTNSHTLETQTSIISITENKTINYTIEISAGDSVFTRQNLKDYDNEIPSITANTAELLNNSLEDGSSKFPISETENENERSEDISENSSDDKIINIIDTDSKDIISSADHNDLNFENSSDFDDTISNGTDIEEDSLECQNSGRYSNMNDTPKSVDNDVAELYSKITKSMELYGSQRHIDTDRRHCGTLTPLTEESAAKKESLMDLTPNNITDDKPDDDKDVLFTNAGIKVKVLPNTGPEGIKLPPIQNQCSPNSPNLSYMFNKLFIKPSTLPCVFENQRDRVLDRWEIDNKELAAGESPLISGRSAKTDHINRLVLENFQLPPIHTDGNVINEIEKIESRLSNVSKTESLSGLQHEPINIKDKIKELKMTEKYPKWSYKYSSISDSRSCSPSSTSPEESRLCDAAERGCEALCVELLRRLRSHSWFDVSDTMADMPHALEKFWSVISEQRIADLIRQVSTHVESPRTQVARTACTTLAAILRNTNYTKKPDFYEAMTVLLAKTGSFCRPVRRAANVALDEIVCAVELSQAISSLCIHGTSHKSHLVRCASARLLVVCCALGGGGRELLRARPPSAAAARKYALRSLASLLDDKNADARKYAERLYSMLRPLAHFEAYYLTDVDVETATRQMKKYDQLLLCGPPNEGR